MKKILLTFLMSATIISGTVLLPAHAETVFAESAVTKDGNISWGASNQILPTNVTTAQTGNVLLGVEGSYITDMQKALDRINAIRKEACDEGVQDPRDKTKNRKLTSSDYVPIKWSSDLEYIARIRAAEASVGIVTTGHTRLNGSSCWTAVSPNNIRSYGEVLAWNGTKRFLTGIEQWYEEKADWTGNTGEVTGHYTQMIDPDNTYVGLATFINPNARYSTTTAGEFTSLSGLDESCGPTLENVIQTVEVKADKVTAGLTKWQNPLSAKSALQAEFTLTAYGCKMKVLDAVDWKSGDGTVAMVDTKGNITGIHNGETTITASCGTLSATQTMQVTGHPNTELKNAKEATCGKEGYTGDKICKDCGVTIEKGTIIQKKAHSWDTGKITTEPTCTQAGVRIYTCQFCGITRTESIQVTGHQYGEWKVLSKASVTSPERQERVCSVCKKSEKRSVGKKLQEKISVNISSLPLKMKQKTKVLKVTGLTNGNYVVSWKISNSKIAKISGKPNGTCTITAGKTAGKATLTITLKRGGKKKVAISVQKGTVKTNKISGVAKTLKLKKKEKAALHPVISPLSSTEKISYKSSNAKVAAVNGKGQITAKKKGTAVITVKSGKKSVKCKVTVK